MIQLEPPPIIYRSKKSSSLRLSSLCSKKPFVCVKGLAKLVDIGNRTDAHQEDVVACSVNLNFGPGNVRWYFVEAEFFEALLNYAKERNIDFFSRKW
ncbi:Histone demethylase UTY [Pseudolycoriella hygida]|uniref:Histone demethylase UTY n=1 Tax=Pseudolycoriella hygida TaxID=35572 RepID=A0A9Q0NFW9_9DIPT|nr:Histone demethylase UTY [Pseudolycoriella hygida]